MLVRQLDLLSAPPQIYFLQKKTNKTLFGGILFIIYIFIMLNITVVYLLDYILKGKYDIRYSLYKNFTYNEEEYNKNEDLNPHLNFTINIKKLSQNLERSEVGRQFYIIDLYGNEIERNKTYSSTCSNMSFSVVYACFLDCDWDFNKDINDTNAGYVLNISYSGYKINHQDKIPLEKNNDKYTFYKEFFFSFNRSTFLNIYWEVIKYKEEKGLAGLIDKLLDKKNEFTSIDIGSYEQSYTERPIEEADPESSLLIIRGLAFIRMINNHNHYAEYIRSKKSILDVLANIGALFSTLFSVFTFIFSFYSINFDNYKLVKEVLSTSKLLKKENKKLFRSKSINFEDIPFNKKLYEKDDITSNDSNKTFPTNFGDIDISKTEKNNSKRIKFIYFILDNFYCGGKNTKKKFDIINICNKILSKYISIDAILYNQIVFESFLKEYTDNFDIIKDNILFRKLKLLIDK